jgi:hypothetical protein
LLNRALHVFHGALHGGFCVGCLLREKDAIIVRFVVPRCRWHGRQRCVRR